MATPQSSDQKFPDDRPPFSIISKDQLRELARASTKTSSESKTTVTASTSASNVEKKPDTSSGTSRFVSTETSKPMEPTTPKSTDTKPTVKEAIPSNTEKSGSATEVKTDASASQKDFKPLKEPIKAEDDVESLQGHKFVYLDPHIHELSKSYEEASGGSPWETYRESPNECEGYIKTTCEKHRAFLVTTGAFGQQLVEKIHKLSQVYAIYIYCASVDYHGSWAKRFSKIRVVCDKDEEELIPQLAFDFANSNREWCLTLLAKGEKNKAKSKLEKALDSLHKHGKDPTAKSLAETIEKMLPQCA